MRAEGRALSISARLRALLQSEMEANNALKLLFRAAQSACWVRRGCSALCRSACREGHGSTAPNPPGPELPGACRGAGTAQGHPEPSPLLLNPSEEGRDRRARTDKQHRVWRGMRVCSAPSCGCGVLGTAALLLLAPEEVTAHPSCHPPMCAPSWHMERGARAAPMGTLKRQLKGTVWAPERWVRAQGGGLTPRGGIWGTARDPVLGQGAPSPPNPPAQAHPGHHLVPLHLLLRASGGSVPRGWRERSRAQVTSGRIPMTKCCQLLPQQGRSPLSSAAVCFAASSATIEAFQLWPLQGV